MVSVIKIPFDSKILILRELNLFPDVLLGADKAGHLGLHASHGEETRLLLLDHFRFRFVCLKSKSHFRLFPYIFHRYFLFMYYTHRHRRLGHHHRHRRPGRLHSC